LETVG
jgi:hypothetical protein